MKRPLSRFDMGVASAAGVILMLIHAQLHRHSVARDEGDLAAWRQREESMRIYGIANKFGKWHCARFEDLQ